MLQRGGCASCKHDNTNPAPLALGILQRLHGDFAATHQVCLLSGCLVNGGQLRLLLSYGLLRSHKRAACACHNRCFDKVMFTDSALSGIPTAARTASISAYKVVQELTWVLLVPCMKVNVIMSALTSGGAIADDS
jgi:nitrite reductase/ring-hydroxylating ferredoxin subunit